MSECQLIEVDKNSSLLLCNDQQREIINVDKPTSILITQGMQGPPGRDGLDGSNGSESDLNYIHTQSNPAMQWEVNHPLNKMPSVTVVDSALTVVEGDIQYIDNNNIILNFSAAFAGKAYLN